MRKINIAFGSNKLLRVGFNSHWSSWGIRTLWHPGRNKRQVQIELGHFYIKLPERNWS